MCEDSLVQVEHLGRVFRDGDVEVHALKDAHFTLKRGEFVALMGKSGSGKTTLLNILATLDSATSGKYVFDGTDITNLSEKERTNYRRNQIAVVYQQFHLIPELTVRENIQLPFVIADKKVPKEEVERMAKWLQVEERLDFFPAKLSGGEKQRVAIARALIMKPQLLLADEPTGNLDSANAEKVVSFLSECAKERKQTILMVTHDAEVASRADRILRISDGVVAE